MTRTELVSTIADITGRPVTTINPTLYTQLQAEGLLPRGAPGNKDAGLTSKHKISLLLGACLGRERGVSQRKSEAAWRKQEEFFSKRVGKVEDITSQLGIDMTHAGAALISILDTIRDWPTEGLLAGFRVTATFTNEVHLALMFRQEQYGVTAVAVFGQEPEQRTDEDSDKIVYQRIVRIPHAAFERLAAE
jgi:hypothetical protein